MMNALALRDDEGRDKLRKALERRQIVYDPEISEWGNLYKVIFININLNT